MSTLINASIRVDKLPKEKFKIGKDGAVYYELTLSVNDETKFGNNVWVTESQTKEERDAKKARITLGNGKVVWTDGTITVAERQEEDAPKQQYNQPVAVEDGLPF
jgi:hypothetical protein|tara:strand:- start:2181 stop:2495 length:315 start_codon:yes stop_codon:yes gene_type:complete